jgi:hypothetical protein
VRLGGCGIHFDDQFRRHPQLKYGGTRAVGVRAVIDGLAHVDDVHCCEAGRAQDARHDIRIGQCEGLVDRSSRHRRRVPAGERSADRGIPLLTVAGLPDQLARAASRVVWPVPQPMSRPRSPGRMSRASHSRS